MEDGSAPADGVRSLSGASALGASSDGHAGRPVGLETRGAAAGDLEASLASSTQPKVRILPAQQPCPGAYPRSLVGPEPSP